MKGSELVTVRERLGALWGLDRPLRKVELGRCLGLQGAVRHTILRWEAGDTELPLHFERLIEAMLTAGYRPVYEVERRKPSRTVGSDL